MHFMAQNVLNIYMYLRGICDANYLLAYHQTFLKNLLFASITIFGKLTLFGSDCDFGNL